MNTYKKVFSNAPELAEVMEHSAQSWDARINANTRGHVWILDEFGHVEIDGSSDFHNHVTCAKCGYVYCVSCRDVPPKACNK